jgi:HK97 family phage major capsid protein
MHTQLELKHQINQVAKSITDVGERAMAGDLSYRAAKTQMDSLEAMLTGLQAEMATNRNFEAYRSQMLSVAGDGADEGAFGMGRNGRLTGRQVAPIDISETTMKSLFNAVSTGQQITVKAATDLTDLGGNAGILPARLNTLTTIHEPKRVMDFLPARPMASPTFEYVQITGAELPTGATPFVVAAGGLKPMVHLQSTVMTGTMSKIAGAMSVVDEAISDFPGFMALVQNELMNVVVDAENAQLLQGPGTGVTIKGLNTYAAGDGAIVRPKATDTRLDALEQAILDLRTGASYAEAELFVFNPADWSKVRREKDSQNRYLVNPDPTQADALRLWGVPVVVTTGQPVGTVLVLAPSLGIEVYVREALNVKVSWVNDDFQKNKQTLVSEERLTMIVTRPSTIVKVTGF